MDLVEIHNRSDVIHELAVWRANRIDVVEALKYDGIVEFSAYDNDILSMFLQRPLLDDVRDDLADEGAIEIKTPYDKLHDLIDYARKYDADADFYYRLRCMGQYDTQTALAHALLDTLDDTVADEHLRSAIQSWFDLCNS